MDHPIERRTRGRQRIEMVQIENANHLLVTFSKRKKGLFKKSNEITILTDAQLVVLVKSPSGKPYVYGSPDIEQIINRYLGEVDAPESSPGVTQMLDAQQKAEVSDLCRQLKEMNIQIETEKKRGEELDALAKEEQEQENNLWELPKGELNHEQLNELKTTLEILKRNVEMNIHQQELMENTNPEDIFLGSSSNLRAIPNDETNPRQYFEGSSSNQGTAPNDETNPWLVFLRSCSNNRVTPSGETNPMQFFAGSSSNQGTINNMASFNANLTGDRFISNTVTPFSEYNPEFAQRNAFPNMIDPPSSEYDIQNMVSLPPQGYDRNIDHSSSGYEIQNMVAPPPQGYDPNMVDPGNNFMNINSYALQGYNPDMGNPRYNFQNLIAPPPLGYNLDTMDEAHNVLNAMPPPPEHNDNPHPYNTFDPPGFDPSSF